MATTTIAMEVHNCAARHTYRATFEGPNAEAMVLAFARARESTHVVIPWEEDGIDPAQFPALYDYLNPLCEHNMSAALCYGPSHYCSDEEIAQGW